MNLDEDCDPSSLPYPPSRLHLSRLPIPARFKGFSTSLDLEFRQKKNYGNHGCSVSTDE